MIAPHVPDTLNFSPSLLQCALSPMSLYWLFPLPGEIPPILSKPGLNTVSKWKVSECLKLT